MCKIRILWLSGFTVWLSAHGDRAAAEFACGGNSLDSNHVCCHTECYVFLLAEGINFVKCGKHDLLKHLVDFIKIPGKVLDVLYPLEVGNNNTTCVGKDIRAYDNSSGVQDLICLNRSRSIGCLDNEFGLDASCVVFCDLVLQGSRDQNVAFTCDQAVVGNVGNTFCFVFIEGISFGNKSNEFQIVPKGHHNCQLFTVNCQLVPSQASFYKSI